MAEHLKSAGWEVGYDSFESLTWDLAKQFNVILLATSIDLNKANVLRQFIENGGGLFYMHAGYQSSAQDIKDGSALFEPYGLKIPAEYFYEPDPQMTYRNTAAHVHPTFARVPTVLPSPVSAGVTNVWVPIRMFDMLYYSTHLVVDPGKGWKVVIKGSPTSYSSATTHDKKITPEKGLFKEAPPLMAVADKNGGRLAVWPVHSTFCIFSGYHWFWEGRMMETGDGMIKSDGLKLFMNTLNWLANPSLKSGKMGGYVFVLMSKSWKKERTQKEPGLIEYDWDKVEFFPAPEVCFRGLVGAHTALSNGKGSVGDYIQEAKKAGYQFVVFTELLPDLTADEFETLKQECGRQSNAEFAAVPGIECQDEVGNSYVVYGMNTYYPLPEHFSEKVKGRIKNIYFFLSMGKQKDGTYPAITAIKTGLNPKPPEFLTAIRGVALFTYERGKLIDDAVNLYWHVQEQGYFLFPSVVHLIYSPHEVAQTRKGDWQFYVLPKLQDYQRPPILSKDVDKVVAGLYETRSFPVARPGYASSGPKILNYQLINPGTSDLSLKENDRQRMRFDVHADKGLKEVMLQDGRKIMRRWRPKGNDFSKTLDLFHDQQRSYILVVTDQQGGKCISQVIGTFVQTHMHVMCGDNQNIMDSSLCYAGRDVLGKPPVGIETYLPSKGWHTVATFSVVVDGKYQRIDADIPATDHIGRLAGEFIVLEDHETKNLYPRNDPSALHGYSGKTWSIMYPTRYLDWTFHEYGFTPHVGGDDIRLYELKCKVKQDMTAATNAPFMQLSWLPFDKVVVHGNGEGNTLVEAFSQGQGHNEKGRLAFGEYIMSYDVGQATQPAGFISAQKQGWPLDYGYIVNAQGGGMIFVNSTCPAGREQLKAGTELVWRYLTIIGPRTLQPSNRIFECVRNMMGVGGGVGYRCEPRIGTVLTTEFALTVQAERGGFAAHFKAAPDLPMDVPLIVKGLNERWSAGIWFKGTNIIHYVTRDYFGTWDVSRVARKETDTVRRIGMFEGAGYCVLDIEKGDRDVFVGNLVICDNPDVVLNVTYTRPDRKEVVVHNPTDKAVTVTVTPAPGFTLFGDFKKTMTIEAGRDETLKL
ncbi:MAG: hypothetical protein L6437_12825 [Kiritimatiellae bacterium]|nr:hypothetical protein [Kiritimatiellia bacterium]